MLRITRKPEFCGEAWNTPGERSRTQMESIVAPLNKPKNRRRNMSFSFFIQKSTAGNLFDNRIPQVSISTRASYFLEAEGKLKVLVPNLKEITTKLPGFDPAEIAAQGPDLSLFKK